MKFGLQDNTLKQIIHILSASPEVEEAILYGSRAKGNFKPASDIDITLKGNISLNDLNKISMALDDLLLPYTFDLSVFNQIENPDLIAHIKRVGKRLWVRKR